MNDISMLSFEFFERAIRLHNHIEKSCLLALVPGTRPTVQVNIAKDILRHLEDVIASTIEFINSNLNIEDSKKVEYLHNRLEHISIIHIHGLPRIPRPHEPIELVSYLRQTSFGILKNDDAVQISKLQIFATEALGNQAHNNFSIKNAKARLSIPDVLQTSIADFAEEQLGVAQEFDSTEDTPLISLPRLDLGNPCRWPSLMHEIGHLHTRPEKIWSLFEAHINSQQLDIALAAISSFSASADKDSCLSELNNWLKECWCDAFSVIYSGPAAFFSQLHAFIFSHPCYLTESARPATGYPPAWFRLKLLLTLSEARLDSESPEMKKFICKAMEDEKTLIYRLFDLDIKYDNDIAQLLAIFKDFLRAAFPKGQHSSSADISSLTLEKLVLDLSKGLPIPSVVSASEDKVQRAATSTEILLAGWIHRCRYFKKDFLEIISGGDTENVKFLIKELKARVDRSDETLKRSIQMAEWFEILNEAVHLKPGTRKNNVDQNPALAETSLIPGPLSDRDISRLLLDGSLRIIPLIDADLQVRGSVIDLRLGHNFEVFFSSVPHVIDPFKERNDEADSMEVDVDFSNGIEIGPGQFILAHTLEYIKLPKNVAAQIEGRSSFARLGLQVHMTANLVEAGFDGCLTLEIFNNGPSTIKLYPGMRIAQLRFYRLVTTPQYPYGESGENKYRGKLSHNKTKQFSDWEVSAIERAKVRFGIKNE